MNMGGQLELFGIFCLLGIGAGILYDGLRLFRRCFPHGLLWISIEDILFWFLIGGSMYVLFFVENNGILRAYGFVGVLLGSTLYEMLISPLFFKKITGKLGKWLMQRRERKKTRRKTRRKFSKSIDE